MSRTPKLGEVWIDAHGGQFTCIDAEPDTNRSYGWSFPHPDGGIGKVYRGTFRLTPPVPPKPEWLNDRWMNVYPDCVLYSGTATNSDDAASVNRIGRVNLGTGEWVPCDGKQVLA